MDARISLITLGVSDLDRAVRFYRDLLGWPADTSAPGVAFLNLNGVILSLYPFGELAKEVPDEDRAGAAATAMGAGAGAAAGTGTAAATSSAELERRGAGRGYALAHNVGSREEVDAIFALLGAGGAMILKEPHETFWGGYSGYFADPDGHRWEVAHNPFWTLLPDGRVSPVRPG